MSIGCRPEKQGYLSAPLAARGDESLMCPKSHGTCHAPVQANLRFGCDFKTADKICCFNRHYAEHAGYFLSAGKTWLEQVERAGEAQYFDSVSGKLLFTAPRGRTFQQFLEESEDHGWPSFRDAEV
jgi:hypothetical protein